MMIRFIITILACVPFCVFVPFFYKIGRRSIRIQLTLLIIQVLALMYIISIAVLKNDNL